VGVFDEIQHFIAAHKPCGRVSGTVEAPEDDGYAVKVRCSCGDTLRCWVTAEAARHDLIYSTLLYSPN
jgi:hypothetical protein